MSLDRKRFRWVKSCGYAPDGVDWKFNYDASWVTPEGWTRSVRWFVTLLTLILIGYERVGHKRHIEVFEMLEMVMIRGLEVIVGFLSMGLFPMFLWSRIALYLLTMLSLRLLLVRIGWVCWWNCKVTESVNDVDSFDWHMCNVNGVTYRLNHHVAVSSGYWVCLFVLLLALKMWLGLLVLLWIHSHHSF